MKSNFVVIVRKGQKEFEKVINLCRNEPFVEWDNGVFCIVGLFIEDEIKKYEYYKVSDDWQTLSGFSDRAL